MALVRWMINYGNNSNSNGNNKRGLTTGTYRLRRLCIDTETDTDNEIGASFWAGIRIGSNMMG